MGRWVTHLGDRGRRLVRYSEANMPKFHDKVLAMTPDELRAHISPATRRAICMYQALAVVALVGLLILVGPGVVELFSIARAALNPSSGASPPGIFTFRQTAIILGALLMTVVVRFCRARSTFLVERDPKRNLDKAPPET